MTDIRIADLAHPELTDEQRAAIARAAAVPVTLTEEAVLDAARRQTGLDDFGSDDFRPRLRVWLATVNEDERMNAVGRLGLYASCVRFLANRLKLTALLARHPEIWDMPIRRPIIVAGLPRSGTTHLLNLMAADTRLRSLPYWESLEPIPTRGEGPGRDGRDPRYLRCLVAYEQASARLPFLKAMHDMPPEHIHEEVELLDLDVASYQLEWVCHAPRWRDHYLSLDMRPHYAYLRTVLQALQWLRGPDRWVLKSPQHLEQLLPLRDTFPDATIVLTHRDPGLVQGPPPGQRGLANRLGQLRRGHSLWVAGQGLQQRPRTAGVCHMGPSFLGVSALFPPRARRAPRRCLGLAGGRSGRCRVAGRRLVSRRCLRGFWPLRTGH